MVAGASPTARLVTEPTLAAKLSRRAKSFCRISAAVLLKGAFLTNGSFAKLLPGVGVARARLERTATSTS